MFKTITRYSRVSAKALKGILATYADGGDSKDPGLMKKVAAIHSQQMEVWKKKGWAKTADGDWVFANQIPQVFTTEHPNGRAPGTVGLTTDEVLNAVHELCENTAIGAEKVGKFLNNGLSLGLRETMKTKAGDGTKLATMLQAFVDQVLKPAYGGNVEAKKIADPYMVLGSDEERKTFLSNWYTPESEED